MRLCHGGMGHKVVLHKYDMGHHYVDIELEISTKWQVDAWMVEYDFAHHEQGVLTYLQCTFYVCEMMLKTYYVKEEFATRSIKDL